MIKVGWDRPRDVDGFWAWVFWTWSGGFRFFGLTIDEEGKDYQP